MICKHNKKMFTFQQEKLYKNYAHEHTRMTENA